MMYVCSVVDILAVLFVLLMMLLLKNTGMMHLKGSRAAARTGVPTVHLHPDTDPRPTDFSILPKLRSPSTGWHL